MRAYPLPASSVGLLRRAAWLLPLALLAASLALLLALTSAPAGAQEDWVVQSFDGEYAIAENGDVQVTEDIRVDFGLLPSHGIFRDIPIRYTYDDKHDRLITVSGISVDNGSVGVPFELTTGSAYLTIKIGDPDILVLGQQRYRIRYSISGGLNPFADHDELFLNVTGDRWDVPIEAASAEVSTPQGAIERVDCFQGPPGSRERCEFSSATSSASFEATRPLAAGEGLTFVTGLRKGFVDAAPLVLVDKEKDDWQQFLDMFEVNALTLGLTGGLTLLVLALITRQWWVAGRDRWYGDMFYLNEEGESDKRKPIGARETIVVEYQPPEIGRRQRRLRPAEIGLLLDERADTLDVTATIVDLAVQKRLKITEERKGGVLGLFKKTDYKLEKLPQPEGELLPYEQRLLNALFKAGDTVSLSSLKNSFYKDLEKVKADLYKQSVKENKFFARDPESVRTWYRVAGIIIAAAGGGLVYLAGIAFGGGFVPIPLIFGGLLLLLLAGAFPRRTGRGRTMYRRCLGFRMFMTRAETERQRFAERANIFHEYLPYAMVYGCVEKWAKAFADLGLKPDDPYWYAGTRPFAPLAFASSMQSFSSSISGTMASTPGGSGGSGFGGGGSSGGGIGGGGGGRW